MKLVVTIEEMRRDLANRFGLPEADIQIDLPPASFDHLYTTDAQIEQQRQEGAKKLEYFKEFLFVAFNDSRPVYYGKKIPMIKAMRGVTGCGLHDAKDFVEKYFTFYS